jgi:hypothetical protein
MAKDPMMGQEMFSKDFCELNKLVPKEKSCKMWKKWLNFEVNVYMTNQSPHILVL